MRRRGMARLLLVALVGVGLLALGGYFGWSEGYNVGLADGGEGIRGYGPGGLFLGIGLFFKLMFILFLVFLVAKIFRFWAWRSAGGPGGHHWGKYGRGYDDHGHGHGEHESPTQGRGRHGRRGDDDAEVV